MKICILGDNGSVHIQKWIYALATHLEIELYLITFDKGIKYKNVNYLFLKSYTNTKLDYLLNIFRVRKFIKKIKPDLVHAHYATSYGMLGACSGFHPFILTGWGADIFDSPKYFFMKKTLQFSLSKADFITVLSQITLIELAKYTNKKISLIPFGVDLNNFIPRVASNSNEIRIGTIRTLSEKYGVDYLIRSFALLHTKYPNLYLDIVGDGPQKLELKKLVHEHKIDNRVVFHGFISQNKNFSLYISVLHSFDIFAILSILDSETFGVAAVEASACKIPVVATDVGGLPEVIDHNITGIIVPTVDINETAKALECLINDKALRTKMGESGRAKVEALFDWQRNVNQMIALYISALKN